MILTTRIKTAALMLALGILIGIGSVLMFQAGISNAPASSIAVVKPAQLQRQADAQRETYQTQIDALETRNTELGNELGSTKTALRFSTLNAGRLQGNIRRLLEQSDPLTATDTLATLAACDTLQSEVAVLLDESAEKDSLYDAVVVGLEEQAANRDSTIELQETQYAALQASFTQSLAQQQTLMDEARFQRKQVRQQRVKSRVLSAALMLVSGFATYQAIQHSQ